MRNLSLVATNVIVHPAASISASTIDLDEYTLYAVSEQQKPDADVDIEVWRTTIGHVVDSDGKAQGPSLVTMFTSSAFTGAIPPASQVISFQALPESRQLAVIMRNGDITAISLDEENPIAEIEGTVEPGISAAAWSPDSSLLAVVTSDDKLILMTSTFDVLSEAPLYTTEFGEDAPINVGWGSKQTQFHGSLGKTAAQAPTLSAIGTSPDDDGAPRVSWRGDGALFVVSSLTHAPGDPARRVLRVYDRQATLQATSEPVAGLEHPVSWRPSGNLIAATQRFGYEGGGAGREGRHDIVFFERNGLRHGEFGIRPSELGGNARAGGALDKRMWGYTVRELSWSSDSNVLSVWIEKEKCDVVQLWTTGNYHWYLKQEISALSSQSSRFTSVTWHPETALCLILTTASELIQYKYAWETFASLTKPPNDTGSVAVLDGSSILLTPFRTQNVPPPMSSCELSLSPATSTRGIAEAHTPIHAAFSPLQDVLAVLWVSGRVELWDLRTRLGPGRGKIMDPSVFFSDTVDDNLSRIHRQIVVQNGSPTRINVLSADRTGTDIVSVLEIDGSRTMNRHIVIMPGRNGRLLDSEQGVIWQAADGVLSYVNYVSGSVTSTSHFPEFCFLAQSLTEATSTPPEDDASRSIFIGLAETGKLYVSSSSGRSRTLAINATSLSIASGFVIFTSSAHEVIFVPRAALLGLLAADADDSPCLSDGWEKRRVERGSRIVTTVSSAMSLVLQMPRGNLETINPRPLVMNVVRQDLNSGNYRKAFFACRKHRIDLNVLVDHNQDTFLRNLITFLEQIDEVDHINLFLTSLGRGSQPPEIIAKLCDAIRLELEKKDLTKYINSILTAYVVKTPPDHEAGLALLLRLRDSEPGLVEDAVKYIIFLVDANSLFDTALGMYDFSLVLLIAQHAQKDPREYLPFLRELRALDTHYQRYKIDDYLRRHEKALRNLSLTDRFDEAVAYIERHQLYEQALTIWKDTTRYTSILSLYGDWLFERRDFRQAASVFVEADASQKAMVAYEKVLQWQELFDLALRQQLPNEEIIRMGYRVAEDLTSKKRYQEAASVLLDYTKDVREAVNSLVQGNHFSEARRIVTLHVSPELLTEVIHPAAFESCAQLVEDISEMREQLRKQLQRLRELRIKKVEEPDAFYGVDDVNLHNVDVMTDVSMPATAFSRYTVAPTATSRSSKRSSRSKRKMERKVGSGKKGTIDEEEYLLKSITKLVARFTVVQGETQSILPHLFQFLPEHRSEGLSLQDDLSRFILELDEGVQEIWRKSEDEEEAVDSWAVRMEEKEKENMRRAAIDRVPKPELPTRDWRLKLLR